MRTQCRYNSQAPECHGEGVTAMTCAEMKSSRAALRPSRAAMKSLILKRSIMIAGQKTSVSLEDEFWQGLKMIAAGRRMPIARLVHQIDRERQHRNLSSAIRLFVLGHYRSQVQAKREMLQPALDTCHRDTGCA